MLDNVKRDEDGTIILSDEREATTYQDVENEVKGQVLVGAGESEGVFGCLVTVHHIQCVACCWPVISLTSLGAVYLCVWLSPRMLPQSSTTRCWRSF